MSDSNRPENRLANETSPYLLQHRANPVDWYPWGDEAIERARSEDKPILLSIGYSSCHWCHVMERESFEDDTTAELMNERYVNIKVDREERPDLDEIYMTSVQLMTGQGGWPMTVFLTPDTLAPFYAGTYFPPDDRMGLPSFRRVLTQLADSYRERRGDIASNASQVAERIAAVSRMAEAKKMPIDRSLVDHAVAELRSHYDRVHGGFGGAPKFPPAMALSLLLRAWRTSGDEEILAIVRHTLRAMAGGGMYDQVGGGFHRYSVDERWLVPHFEKMLYDNALLAVTYTEAFQAEGDPLYERVVRETLDWVLEEMITSDGAFASSIDADSEGEEGKFFVWMREEWEAVLGDDAAILAEYYGLDGPSNFENGTWIPFVARDVTVRRAAGEDVTDLERAIERGRAALLAARRKRTAPDRDDKVLVDWNGLMIRAMALAGQVFEEPRYVAAAQSAARFILERMRTEDGGLLRTYRASIAKIGALQTDYAALGLALVDLYESDFDPQWITSARELADRMIADFHDQEHGGFFYVSRHAEIPIARSKNPFDNAVPSGNALAIPLLSRLGRLTGESKYLEVAERTLATFAGMARQMSGAFAQYLAGVDAWLDRASNPDIAFVPGTDSEKDAALLRSIRSTFVPDKVVAEVKSGGLDAPWLADKEPPSGTDHATVFVCRYGRCDEPTSDPDRVRQQLESKRHSENQP